MADIDDRAGAAPRGEAVAVATGTGLARRFTSLPRGADVAISAGAVIGVIGRFWISGVSGQQVPLTFPIGTLLINLAGCLLIGIMQTLFLELLTMRRTWQLFSVVGMLGGFTTFSTLSVETVQLLGAGRVGAALLYQSLSLGGGLLAVVGGAALVHAAHARWRV